MESMESLHTPALDQSNKKSVLLQLLPWLIFWVDQVVFT